MFEYDCGATTDFSTHIAILRNSEKFDPFDDHEDELVLVADSDRGAVAVDGNGMLQISTEWKDATHLIAIIPHGTRIFRKKTVAGGVSIEYRLE